MNITPFVWLDGSLREVVAHYREAFGPAFETHGEAGEGQFESVTVTLYERDLILFNGGPTFVPTPSISYVVSCRDPVGQKHMWDCLTREGEILMDLGDHGFSPLYGWCNDRFGVSWQLTPSDSTASLVPMMMFAGDQHGRGAEAIAHWTSIFPESGSDSQQAGPGGASLLYGAFHLDSRPFAAIDSDGPHQFGFSLANSFLVSCESQSEIDLYWHALIDGGGTPGQCGWLQDRFGVSWQVIPAQLGELLSNPDPVLAERVRNAMMQMIKMDLSVLRAAATP